MGPPKVAEDIPLAEEFATPRTIESANRPDRRADPATPSAVNMGNPHAIFW